MVTLGAPTHLPSLPEPELERVFDPGQLAAASPALSDRPLPPVLAIHGARDRSVPVDQARRLKAAHPDSVELMIVERGDHLLRWPPGVGLRPIRAARRWLGARLVDPSRRSKWRAHRKKKG